MLNHTRKRYESKDRIGHDSETRLCARILRAAKAPGSSIKPNTLTELLHGDTYMRQEARVLEAGCGRGGSAVTLARNSPQAEITSVDFSNDSLNRARSRIKTKK